MDSTWKSKIRVAKKRCKCIYCDDLIMPGNQYYRETGIYENEINDYCLCVRCKLAVIPLVYNEAGNYELGKFINDINSRIKCERCYKIDNIDVEYINTSFLNVTCKNCGFKSKYNLRDIYSLIKLFKG